MSIGEEARQESLNKYGPCKCCGRAKYDHCAPFEYAALLEDQRHGCFDGFQPQMDWTPKTAAKPDGAR